MATVSILPRVLRGSVSVSTIFALPMLALGATAATGRAQSARSATTDVPVTKVILFSSGVGYFEHSGSVHGNAATELRFKTAQINDILKSIMLQDQDGGRIGAITYPSQDPLAKTLKSFQVDITKNPSMAELLNQLRGARVTVQLAAGAVTGTVLGVETRAKPTAQGEVSVPVLNLLSGASIREVELPSISNLTLDDPQLQDELTKALAALVQARDQDKKPVTINFSGAGDRRVRIGYVVETPIWKTSYRLLLGDKGTSAELQGWAIVENQTESDWTNVSLALVSGRPISFTMDLYQPLYATRPNVVPELFAGLHPQVYAGGTEEAREHVTMEAPAEQASGTRPGVASGVAQRRIGYGPDGKPSVAQLQEVVVTGASDGAGYDAASVRSIAAAGKLGELFQYTVGNVTLARQKSAMLPIVTDSIQAERVSIYNEGALQSNPLNGVWLRNTTGKHLLQGPVTVLEKGGYAGDARIDNVPPRQDRLLSYGVDLDVTMTTATHSAQTLVTAKLNRGSLIVDQRTVATEEYAADNKSDKSRMLVVEHPIRQGWKLVSSQKPFETTPAYYRFKGAAAPGKVTTLVVTEERVESQVVALANVTPGMLQYYSRNGEISRNVLDAINKAIQMRQAVADVEQQVNAITQHVTEITAEQNRIRENMKTVAPSGQYYDRLLAKLNEQETTIEKLQAERAALLVKRSALQKDLDEYLSNLTVS